ncbi:acyl carrier protein [Streptomyces rochei]|uniref:acyl carrier protein n=1 Tax=Streptomyces rochei TaxID=1928 RepID=UPI0036936E54
MTQHSSREHLDWLQHVFAERTRIEVGPSDNLWEHGMNSIHAALVASEIHRRYDVPLRVSWEWLLTLTPEEIAIQLASAPDDRGHGAHDVNG